MAIKQQATAARNSLQQGIYKIINPFVRLMIRIGITPNVVTTIGFLGNLAAACVIVWAGYKAASEGIIDWSLLTWGGALIIGFSLFDMLDGQVARLGNMSSTFGAMYDSVLDRYCELITLGAISYYFCCSGQMPGALMAFLALMGSLMVSYVRARGEGLGVVCKIGFMQRPERVVVTSLATLATGIVGQCGAGFDPNIVLVIAMAFIAVFANITAFARLGWCKRALQQNSAQ